jgi:hypothetical protein
MSLDNNAKNKSRLKRRGLSMIVSLGQRKKVTTTVVVVPSGSAENENAKRNVIKNALAVTIATSKTTTTIGIADMKG